MFISNINFSLGEINDISLIEEIQSEKELKTLKCLGLEKFSKSHFSEFELAYTCAKKSVDECSKVIDLAIYVSCSLDNHEIIKDQFSKLMCDLGLQKVYPIGAFISRCSNFTMALKLAENILKTESDVNTILIILSDKINLGENRIHSSNYVSSDSASSCIVSNIKLQKSFEVLDIQEYVDNSIYSISAEKNFLKYIECYSKAIKKVSHNLMSKLNLLPKDFSCFLCGNYNSTIMINYARICGFDNKKVMMENLSKYGHTFSSNSLISLKTLIPKVKTDDIFFLLTTGDLFFGAIALKYNN